MPRLATGQPGDGKRHPLGLRTTKELRDRLEAASAASGRSLAQEVEHRLEQSFGGHFGDLLDELLADQALRMLAANLVLALERGGRKMAETKGISTEARVWARDPDCMAAAYAEAAAACGFSTGIARGSAIAKARSAQ